MNRVCRFPSIVLLVAACSVALLLGAAAIVAQDAAAIERLNQALDKLKTYQFGQSREPLIAAAEIIHKAHGSAKDREAMEERLIALLQTEATFDCKQFVCHQLSEMGTERCVPVLAGLLTDEKLSNAARFALQRNPSPKAGDVLRAALGTLTGDLRIGVVNSIAARGDRSAVPDLAKLAGGQDAALSAAAISALGRIGGGEAAKLLADLSVPDDLKAVKANALLLCADQMAAAGEIESASTIYGQLISEGNPVAARIGALGAIARRDGEKSLPRVLALLKDADPLLQLAAAKFAASIPGDAATKSLTEQLPSVLPNVQIALLAALSARGDKAVAPAVAKLAENAVEDVRIAAIQALGALGGASNVLLLAKAATGGGRAGKAAAESLDLLNGEGVDAAMVSAMSGSEPGVRAALIRSLVARDYDAVVPVLFDAMKEYEPDVHKAACKALGGVAGREDLPRMVGALADAKNPSARRDLEQAISATVARLSDADACAEPVIAVLPKSSDEAKVSLLAILNRAGGEKSLAAIRAQLTSDNPAVKKAAIQAMAEWPDAAPLAELFDIAKNEANEVNQILALRGYIRQVTMLSKRSDEETVTMLREAMALAKRPEEEKAILAVLPSYPCPEAVALAESCLNDEQVAAEAQLAYKKLSRMEGQKFDFQAKGAPVMEGFVEVNAATLYSDQQGYGWTKAPYAERDRKAGTNLTRDFIFDRAARTFRVKVANGPRVVTVFLGDMATQHDEMQVFAEGQPKLQKITNKTGEVKELFFDVQVEDGVLDIEFRDAGGKDPNWTCAGLIVGK